jgi:CRP-like cAMP-binding protein
MRPPEDPKAQRIQRSVQALVSLIRREGITDIENVDLALTVVRKKLHDFFARQRLQKRSRGVISLLGLKKRNGQDLWDPHLGEEHTELPQTDEQRRSARIVGLLHRVSLTWAFYRFVVQLYIFFAVIFRICFEVPRDPVSWSIEFVLIDLSSWLTIAYRFIEPRDDKGIITFAPRETAKAYAKGWFAFDLLGALPFDFIGLAIAADWAKCTVRFHRCGFIAPYWQLNRLLNCRGMFDTFHDVLEMVMLKFSIHPYTARLISNILNFAALTHSVACGLFLLFVIQYEDFETLHVDSGKMLSQVGITFQYFACMDWAAKNLSGQNSGNSFPNDWWQLLYNVATAFIGVTFFAILLATIANYVSRPSPLSNFCDDLDAIMDIMDYKGFPRFIQDEILGHMRHSYNARTHLLTYNTVLGELPTDLLERILLKEGIDTLASVPLFKPHLPNKRFVVNLAKLLQPNIFPPHHVVFEKGERGNAMYFVSQGWLAVVDDEDHAKVKFRINHGGFVGEIALLMDGLRTATVVVGDQFCNVMTLWKESFGRLSNQFPQIFRAMHEQARERFMELNKHLFDNARLLGEVEEQSKKLRCAAEVIVRHDQEKNEPRRRSIMVALSGVFPPPDVREDGEDERQDDRDDDDALQSASLGSRMINVGPSS